MNAAMTRWRRPWSAIAVGALLAGMIAATTATSSIASADASTPATGGPVLARTTNMVSAKALPTVQIDGVAWSQAVVGNTVYAGGQFTTARPAGAAPGVNTTPRSNLLAYDITTGSLISSFNPVVNGIVKSVAASPDGSRIYIGGSFTAVNGVKHNRIAAFSTATGALIATFAPNLDAQVNSISATNATVYAGGNFSTANGVARARAAAFTAAAGALTTWNPSPNSQVAAVLVEADNSKVILGGNFSALGSTTMTGFGAVNPDSGAVVPWAIAGANSPIHATGVGTGITSLSTDGKSVFGTAYSFNSPGGYDVSNLEGAFSADARTGNLNWVDGCRGDSYDAFPTSDALYLVSHTHQCNSIGGFPDMQLASNGNAPDTWYHRATAYSLEATGTGGATNPNDPTAPWAVLGKPTPSLYNWFPDLAAGSFTGQTQAAWSVTGNGKYIALAGEFPTVNGVPQQGLTRFANTSVTKNSVAPKPVATSLDDRSSNVLGATTGGPLTATATPGNAAGTASVTFTPTWDADDLNLTYQLFRDGGAVPVASTVVASTFWNLPTQKLIDTSVTPGAHSYVLRVSDPGANTASYAPVNVRVLGDSTLTASTDAGKTSTTGTVTLVSGTPLTVKYATSADTATPLNWIGVYTTGDNPFSGADDRAWKAAPGAGGSLTFDSSAFPTAGTYRVYYFYDNGHSSMAAPLTVRVVGGLSAASPAVDYGQPITLHYAAPSSTGNSLNWVGLYPSGVVPSRTNPELAWANAPAAAGTAAIDTTGLAAGTYTAWYLADDAGYTPLADPLQVAVKPAASAALSTTTPSIGTGSVVSVQYSVVPALSSSKNWIGIYKAGRGPAQGGSYAKWVYAPGGGGTAQLKLDGVAPGSYQAWYFYNDGYTTMGAPLGLIVK